MKYTIHHIESQCPVCQCLLNASAPHDGKTAPKTGDFSLCVQCGSVLRFGDSLELSQADPTDIVALAETCPALYDQIKLSRAAIAQSNPKRGDRHGQ